MADSSFLRFDAAKASQFRRDARGFLRATARLTRSGVFTYRRADGSVVKEYRPEEEVSDPESLATLAGATVTDLHPDVPVSPLNARELGRGHVSEDVRYDSGFVESEVIVDDAELISTVERRDGTEVSLGYSCEIDPTSGMYKGERYDQIQRRIRYNHAALGPKGWGRAGPQVALRADSNDAVQVEPTGADPVTNENTNTAPAPNYETNMTVKLRLDSGVAEIAEDSVSVVEKAIADRDAQIETLRADGGKAQTEIKDLQAKADKLEAERDDALTKLAKAEEPKSQDELQSLVKARLDLERGAAVVLGAEFKADSLTDDEIKTKVLEKARPEIKLDSKSADYIQAAFELAIADATKSAEALGNNRGSVVVAAATRDDSNDDKDVFATRRNAHKNYLAKESK